MDTFDKISKLSKNDQNGEPLRSAQTPSVQHISSTLGTPLSARKIPQFQTKNPSVQHTPQIHTKKPSVPHKKTSVPYRKPLSSTHSLRQKIALYKRALQFLTERCVELRGFWCGTEGYPSNSKLWFKIRI